MVSLGQFSYDLTIANGPALQALQAVERQAVATRGAVQGQSSQFTLKTDQATAALGNLTKAALAAAAAIQKPITPQVNTKPAESQLQKFGQQFASGLGFGSGAAVAVTGINAITDALKEAIVGGIQYNAQIETATTTLELFTGSSVVAGQALQKLRQYADFTPFDTDEVIAGGNAFIKSVDGDVAAMERLVHLAGQLAATNPDVSAGGGYKSAVVALREVLGDQFESIADRFNIPRSTIQSLRDAGLSGEALAAALVKAAHGSEELVDKLSTTAAGQFSNFTSAIKNLEQAATRPIFAELGRGLTEANKQLSTNSAEWTSYATAVGNATVFIAKSIPAMLQTTQAAQILALGQALGSVAGQLQRLTPQQAAELEFGGLTTPLAARQGPSGATSTEDPHADNFAAAQSSMVHAAAESAKKLKDQATSLGADLKELNDDTTRHAIQGLDDQVSAARKAASAQKSAIEDVRDAAIKAADGRRDAAIASLDREQQAVSRARTQQDRTIADQNDAILAGLEKTHEAQLKGLGEALTAIQKRGDAALKDLDREIDAIGKKRDADLRAIDAEVTAENRRHSTAIANIDRERDAKLGGLDKELRAIDASAQRDQRRQTDQSLSRALSDAKQELKNADTPEQRARARRAIADAETAIQREQANRAREDARARIRDQQDAIRAAAEAGKAAENTTHTGNTDALSAEKQQVNDQAKADTDRIDAIKERVKEETKIEADSITERVAAENEGYQQTVKDQQRAFELQARALADQRTNEDQTLADRRRAVQTAYEADAADARATADEQTKALEASTQSTIEELDKQKRAWNEWKEYVQGAIADAIKKGNPGALNGLQVVPPSLQNAGQGTGEAPSHDNIPSLANLKQEYGPTSEEIGAAIAAGVSEGLAGEQAQAQIKGATDAAIQTNVIDEAKSLLGVKSPSTVFRQIGADTVAGFQDGYQAVPLAPVIRAPFEEARDWLTPYWIGTMTDIGAGANANFVAGYDGPSVNLGIMSPFNQFFDTDSAHLVEGFKNVGISTGKSLGDGFISANPGDRIFAEVRGAAVDLTRLYPTFVQLGYNFGVSMANGFSQAVADWHALEAGGVSAGAQVAGYAAGGSPPIGQKILVGERGPELFVPTQAGQIIPADQTANIMAAANGSSGVGGGGGAVSIGSISVSVQGQNRNAAEIAAEVGPMIAENIIVALDAAHRNQPTRLDRTQPGAN